MFIYIHIYYRVLLLYIYLINRWRSRIFIINKQAVVYNLSLPYILQIALSALIILRFSHEYNSANIIKVNVTISARVTRISDL